MQACYLIWSMRNSQAGRPLTPRKTRAPARAIDIWIAVELRRAGLEPDAVWPRPDRPRILPQSLSSALERFKYSRKGSTREIQEATISRLFELAGRSSSTILGGFFAKEIDVVIAEHDRGLELGVSTKTMTKSFGKNVTNRFEEASGDLLNIRRRFPLATFGYVFVVTPNVFDEPHAWERIKDMCRKLKTLAPGDDRGSYDASCLIVLRGKALKLSSWRTGCPSTCTRMCSLRRCWKHYSHAHRCLSTRQHENSGKRAPELTRSKLRREVALEAGDAPEVAHVPVEAQLCPAR